MPKGWTVRGSNPGGGEIFRTCPDRPWGPPSLLYNGYRIFPGGNVRPGRDADLSPLLVPRSKIGKSYTSTLPKGLRGLWQGETYLKYKTVLVNRRYEGSCMQFVMLCLWRQSTVNTRAGHFGACWLYAYNSIRIALIGYWREYLCLGGKK
jgi:hypothetical protein